MGNGTTPDGGFAMPEQGVASRMIREVPVMQAPDDEIIAAAMLGVAALGNTRTTTPRAFGRQEFEEIRAKPAGDEAS